MGAYQNGRRWNACNGVQYLKNCGINQDSIQGVSKPWFEPISRDKECADIDDNKQEKLYTLDVTRAWLNHDLQ